MQPRSCIAGYRRTGLRNKEKIDIMSYCFGIDVGGTSVKMGLFRADGEMIDKWEIKSRTENGGEAILPDISDAITAKLKERGINTKEVLGIGMGVPAPVNREGIVKATANLGWGYKEVSRELEELSGLKVVTGNDANVAALGEMWKGGGKGHENMIMVTLGTGVGGGIIVNGSVLSGENGAGGEIGHLTVNADEEEACGCGRKGCLEEYASATGIVRLAARRLERDDKPSSLRGHKLSAKAVFNAVKEDDAVAIEIAEEFGRYLGYALSDIAVLVDPAIVVIGGGVSKAGEILFRFIEPRFRDRVFFANKEMEFALAELGNDAGMHGAAKLVLN